jgi:CheY-like chemotaxis protein
VTVELATTDDEVRVAVHDTGIGIPPEALDKVFTRFYQYDSSSTRKYGGTGIGLSIAQDIARLHGTRITVTSEAGKGSTFRFSLPLRERRAAADTVADEPVAVGTRLLIELVTRDRALSTQIRNLLASEGMDVIHAMNAVQAIGLAQRHSPNCVIVDTEGTLAGQPSPLLDKLLADRTAGQLPIILMTNEEALYARYRPLVASRVKRSFRKSALLSGIQYAVGLAAGVGETTGHRILCVDDDPEILTFMQRCLETEGYEVTTCATGAEAVERVGTGEFGLVLLDLAMPDVDGWETCRRIKTDLGLNHVKVIIVTAKPVDSSSQRFREEGADGYLLKPFRAEDLLEIVHGLPVLRVTKEA